MPRFCPTAVPRLILKPLGDEIRDDVDWLSIVTTHLYCTDIPRYQPPVIYPKENAIPRIDYFCDVVVQPVLDLLYSLRFSASWPPITYSKSTSNDHSSVIIHKPRMDPTIATKRKANLSWPLPVVIVLTPTMLHGIVTSDPYYVARIADILKPIWESDPDTYVLGCDFKNVLTLRLQHDSNVREIICSYAPIPMGNIVSNNYGLARHKFACRAANEFVIPLIPRHVVEIIKNVTGIGPLLPPEHTPLLPDNAIFARYCRHSDFDYPLIARSKEHWAQFSRWKTHLVEIVASHVSDGDVLLGMTDRFAQVNPLLQPFYPAILPPKPTMQTFESCQRTDPLREFSPQLTRSSSFTVRVLRELTQSQDVTGPRPCRTYVCQLLTIDDCPLNNPAPLLCLMLYDDRFLQFQLFQKWQTAEDLVRNEIAVYQKLDFMQASLLPYFYRAHLFTLPSGPPLHGILMEYLDAPMASKESIQALSEDEQLQLIRSTRHGIRILQYADISQHDWHRRQILIYRHESSVHYVFIDFAACTQSLGGWQEHTSDDIEGSAYSLIGNGVLSQEWVAQVYGHREVWDR
ncbi:hypothetical protein QCA50_002592 [Cerrena zonata]|uniref:Uncharacterized protein n=1 Tax=Cerrena zonata TaxID=2478898 RepID=A0AAW0GSY6_9APHY